MALFQEDGEEWSIQKNIILLRLPSWNNVIFTPRSDMVDSGWALSAVGVIILIVTFFIEIIE